MPRVSRRNGSRRFDPAIGAASAISVRAFRTIVSDGIEDVAYLRDRLIGRNAGGRLLASEIDGAGAGVRVGPVLGPAMLLAFVDGASLLQHAERPSPQRADRRPSFLRHQHRDVISIEIAPRRDESAPPLDRSRRLARVRDSQTAGPGLSTCSGSAVENAKDWRRGLWFGWDRHGPLRACKEPAAESPAYVVTVPED